jgi:hypothetical protein
MPIGMPGCPDFAFSTASIASARIAFAIASSRAWGVFRDEPASGIFETAGIAAAPQGENAAKALNLLAEAPLLCHNLPFRFSRAPRGSCIDISRRPGLS